MTNRPLQRCIVLAGTCALLGAAASSATPPDDPRATLAQAEAAGRLASQRAAQLSLAAQTAGEDSARARAAAVAVAARIQSAEADIATAEARIGFVEQLRAVQRTRLAEKQRPAVKLMTALQTMALRPPALALARPGTMSDLVHVHAVLAGLVPVLRSRTLDLRADVERGRRLRITADAALDARRQAQQSLVTERQRLVAIEARRRVASVAFASVAMTEQDRAIAMAEEARDITDLMGRIDTATAIQSRLASLPGPLMRPGQPGNARSLPVDGIVPVAAPPAYRLPVVGRVVSGLGEMSENGVRARGLTIATAPAAQVVAPTSGRIAFAGPFRGYGMVVVIDHGLGWTTLLANLATLDVATGDQVDRGSPIGRAGDRDPTVTVELRRQGQPVDIAKLAG